MIHPELKKISADNAGRYAKSKNRTIENELGFGKEGYVLQTTRPSAVKAFYFPQHYRHELEVYKHLKKWKISRVAEFHIPELIGHNSSLRVIDDVNRNAPIHSRLR